MTRNHLSGGEALGEQRGSDGTRAATVSHEFRAGQKSSPTPQELEEAKEEARFWMQNPSIAWADVLLTALEGAEAENEKLRASLLEAVGALRDANEALAQVTAFEDDARYIMGNTNFSIVQMRLAAVKAAITRLPSSLGSAGADRSSASRSPQPLSAGKPWDLYGPLADLTASLEALISESDGVYGLHKNGDPAPWGELLAGGRFEDWLCALAAARRALDAETAYRAQPPAALWIGDDDAADAARYRHLKEHHSYYYAEQYDRPQPREFGIQWEHQDSTPARPSMDWLIDQEIAAKRLEDEEYRAEAWGFDPAESSPSGAQRSELAISAPDDPKSNSGADQ